MSIALMTMARKTALSTNAKFTLMALADWADDNGTNCWPSIYELSEYLTCSERTVQRLLRELEEGGWIAVVGNHNGGGTSRQYALNVPKMDAVSKIEHVRREAEKERRRRERKNSLANPFFEGCHPVTPVNLSPVTTGAQGVTNQAQGVTTTTSRGDTGVTPSTIDPPKDPPKNQLHPALPVAVAAHVAAKPVAEKETELQAACRETWAAYAMAYAVRYGAAPVRNAAVNAKVKQVVQRLGREEAPAVAAFFVQNVCDPFVVHGCHSVGALLQGAEAYRTQWATGRAAKKLSPAPENFAARTYVGGKL